jgi:acyl carrier protein
VVEGFVREIVGEEYALGIDLDMDTSIADDLELESIEFVRMGEKLQEHYGSRIDLVAWFADFDVDQIIALTVGELVDYIRRSVA